MWKKFKLLGENFVTSAKFSAFKFPSNDKPVFDVFNPKDMVGNEFSVEIKGSGITSFNLTGFSKNSAPNYQLPDHYIIGWDTSDTRNYFAVEKTKYSSWINSNSKPLCGAIADSRILFNAKMIDC